MFTTQEKIEFFNSENDTNIILVQGVKEMEDYISQHPAENEIYFMFQANPEILGDHVIPVCFKRYQEGRTYIDKQSGQEITRHEIKELFIEMDSLGRHSLFLHNSDARGTKRAIYCANFLRQASESGCVEDALEVLRDVQNIGIDSIFEFCKEHKGVKMPKNLDLVRRLKIDTANLVVDASPLEIMPEFLIPHTERWDTIRKAKDREIFERPALPSPTYQGGRVIFSTPDELFFTLGRGQSRTGVEVSRDAFYTTQDKENDMRVVDFEKRRESYTQKLTAEREALHILRTCMT